MRAWKWRTIPNDRRMPAEGLGTYGRLNASEMIGEGFAEWRPTPHPRSTSTAIGRFIDEHFKGKR